MTARQHTVRRRKVSAAGFRRIGGADGNLVDEVADHIRARLEEGLVAVGERMPSERDLAAELGVSRAILRESLSSLESLGYLEARVGQGRFVADPSGWKSQRLIDDWLRRHEAELRDLIELRAVIESQALRGAAGDLWEMAVLAREHVRAQARAVNEERYDDAAEDDMAFHLLLSGSTPNKPLRALAHILIERARTAAHAAYRVPSYRRGSLRQHRLILAALRSGDRDRAADLLMEHHMSRVDQLGTYLERPSDPPPHREQRQAGGPDAGAARSGHRSGRSMLPRSGRAGTRA